MMIGCDQDSPRDEYTHFRERTASERDGQCGAAARDGVLTDITGLWAVRALLNGGISLGLRIQVTAAPGETASPPRKILASFWLFEQAMDAPPLVTSESLVDDNGHFTMVADPLELGPEVLGSESTVIARVELNGSMQAAGDWCGTATGMVVSPLDLDLSGSTFAAQPWEDGIVLDAIPFQCPGDPCAPDMGISEMDAGVIDGDAGVERPTIDPFEVPGAQQTDLTGEWLLAADLGGLPLNLWVSLLYRASETTASVDGVIRLQRDTVNEPPRTTFSALVDEDGRFEVWLPNFALDVNGLAIEGDVLLSAVSFVDGWCGMVAGEIRSPLPLDLDGSSFGAERWIPESPVPETRFSRCLDE